MIVNEKGTSQVYLWLNDACTCKLNRTELGWALQYQGSHQIFKTKFPDISLTFQAVWRKIPWHVVHKSKQVIWSAPPPLHRILFLASTRGGMSNVFNVSNLLWGFGGVTPEKILKFHIAKYAFSRILNDTTQATVKIPWHKPQFPKIPWHFPDIPVIF